MTKNAGQLFVVATPIGNLGDMSARAVECLRRVDLIACEDTRTSRPLLRHFGVDTPTCAYHDHNAAAQTIFLVDKLKSGKNIALISDAGTPLVSDPGFRLIKACHENGARVSPVAGPSAAIAALSVAGLPSDRFLFCGFLPAKSAARQSQLKELACRTETLIFYEAPHRVVACLQDMRCAFGDDRQATLCRELSKTFETVRKDTLANLSAFVQSDPNQQKGEIVLVAQGYSAGDGDDLSRHDALLLRLLRDLPPKKACALASDLTGAKKNALYERALVLKENADAAHL